MTTKLIFKNLSLFFLLALLFLPNLLSSQDRDFTQAEIDEYQIKPLNRENLEAFRRILEEKPELRGWTKYYAFYGYYMLSIKERDSAIYYAQKAIRQFENSTEGRAEDERNLVNAYFAIGRAYYDKKEYQNSTTNLLKCLELEKKYPVKARAYIISSVANNHIELGNDSLAVHYYKIALNDSLYASNSRSLMTVLVRIGALYGHDRLNLPDSSKYYYHRALKVSKTSSYKGNLSTVYGNLGSLHYAEGNIDSTLYYYIKANEILKQHKPLTEESTIKASLFDKTNYSFVKIHQGKLNEAIADLSEVLKFLEESTPYDKNDRELFLSTFENLILAYQKKGDHAQMYNTFLQKDEFLDGFHKTQLKQELEKLQIQYETKEKESEIVRLETLNENQAVIQRQQRIIFYSIGGLLLIVLAAIWLYFYQRNLNNKYKRVVLQQQLLRTQIDPHFLFNTLNTAVVLSKKEPKRIEEYILSLSKLMRLILENSREEFVPLNREVEALENFLLLQSSFSNRFTYAIHVDKGIDDENSFIPPMMVQPFVENAIVHGIASMKGEGDIRVVFEPRDDSSILCEIKDNGVGYDKKSKPDFRPSKKHHSLSEKIIRERFAIYNKKFKMKASISIEKPGGAQADKNGTLVKLVLPLEFDLVEKP